MKHPVKRPHDKFFKETLGDPEIAKDFLANYLPESLSGKMDLSSLQRQSGSFVDENLQEYFADLLYRVQLSGRESYLYFLLEHKSYSDPDIALQLLNYIVSVYRHLRKKEKKAKLPAVIPLVFYHGKEKWTLRPEFSALVEDYGELSEEIRRYIPEFSYRLYDMGSYADEELRGDLPLLLALRTLKYIFEGEETFLESFVATVRLLESLPEEKERAGRFELLMNYVFLARKEIDLERMKKEMRSISSERGEQLMSMAEKLWMQGKMEGKMEGKVEGLEEKALEIARNLLKMNTEVPFVARATGLSEDRIHLLRLEMKKEK